MAESDDTSEKIRFDMNNGRIGIGTDSPSEKIEVKGNIYLNNFIDSGGSNTGAKLLFDASYDTEGNGSEGPQKIDLYNQTGNYGFGIEANTMTYFTANKHKWYTTSESTTARMILDNDKLGIGTTSPSNTLTINGALDDTVPILGLRSGNSTDTFNDGAQIAFGYNGTDEYQHFIHTRHNSISSGNAIDFYVSDGTQNNTVTSGSTHNMSLVSGSVGIGTTSPAGTLNIHEATGTAATATTGSLVISHGDASGKSSIMFPSVNNAANDFAFIEYTEDSGSSSSEEGRLRIGCQNDSFGGNMDVISFYAASTDIATIDSEGLKLASGKAIYIGGVAVNLSTNSGTEWVYNGTNINNVNAGNVGIGTASPVAKLDVNAGGSGEALRLRGTSYHSHFYHGTNEDTYIRPGLLAGNVYIADVGNYVGIGTASNVSEKLQVYGNLRLDNGSTTNNQQGAAIKFDNGFGKTGPNKIMLYSNTYGFGVQGDTLTYHAGLNHTFRYGSSWDGTTNGDNGTLGMTLNSGNLGIGTSAPAGALHIHEETGTAAAISSGAAIGSLILSHNNAGGASSITISHLKITELVTLDL